MPYRFTVIAHSELLIRAVRRECTDQDIELSFVMADFYSAGPLAEQALREGAEIVLCHGGTGRCVTRVCERSVVVIQRSELDAIRTLRQAQLAGQTVICAVHEDEPLDFAAIEELAGVRLQVVRYADADLLYERLRTLYREGLRYLIGGGVTKRFMDDLGGEGHVITLSGPSIQSALAQARVLAAHQRQERGHYQDMRAIFRQMEQGILCVDRQGKVVFTNDAAKPLLGLDGADCGMKLEDAAERFALVDTMLAGVPRTNILVDTGRDTMLASCFPLTGNRGRWGAVAFFRDVPSVHRDSRKVNEALRCRGLASRYQLADIVGTAEATANLRGMIARYAATDAAVWIGGETGAGKELAAHALHACSSRQKAPFVAVNCAAIPHSLLESELFGYEEGAFTGARKGGKMGLFEMAHRGTLFLDEVGDMSPETQLRLLRVLETREVMRLGGNRLCPVDIRLISASNRNLRELVEEGRFRLDLFYRLSTLKLHVPTLRERIDDYLLLLGPLLARYGRTRACIEGEVDALIRTYPWPGNVRELLAVGESYLLLLGRDRPDPLLFRRLLEENRPGMVGPTLAVAVPMTLKRRQQAERREAALTALVKNGGNKTAAARSLGVSPSTLWRILNADQFV